MKPILFNTKNIRAILNDQKTTTRRVIKPQPRPNQNIVDDGGTFRYFGAGECKPPYKRGDILYVRETWAQLWYVDPDGYTHYDQPMFYYAADGTPDITLCDADGFELDDQRIRWRPSIHMPKKAARLFLQVTDVRVERLGMISVRDIAAEGCVRKELRNDGCACKWKSPDCMSRPCANRDAYEEMCWCVPFSELWDSTIKKKDIDRFGWNANPWVWVIEFQRISREEAMMEE